jgi:hypothetical protein
MYDVTDNLIALSSVNDIGTAFDELVKLGRGGSIEFFELAWWHHPLKAEGLYRAERGKLVLLDRDYWAAQLTERGIEFDPAQLETAVRKAKFYKFKLDDAELPLRSPWFDRECVRRSRRSIMMELMMRADAGTDTPYSPVEIEWHTETYGQPPTGRYNVLVSPNSPCGIVTTPRQDGPLSAWLPTGPELIIDHTTDYVMGIDVATGSTDSSGRGASNSAITFASRSELRTVAQYKISGMLVTDFAEIAWGLARMFYGPDGPAKMIWEGGGIGEVFRDVVMNDLGAVNVFQMQRFDKTTREFVNQFGYKPTASSKKLMHERFAAAISRGGRFIVHSTETLTECGQFRYGPGGKIVHKLSLIDRSDLRDARSAHGDLVVSTALCWIELWASGALTTLATERPKTIDMMDQIAKQLVRTDRHARRPYPSFEQRPYATLGQRSAG